MDSYQNHNERIAKNAFVLYLRMLFVMGVSLYTSRVVLAELGVTDYGIYNVVGSVVTIFTFISQALSNATNRFIVFSIGEGDGKKTMQVFNTCIRVHLAIAFLVVIIIETFGLWFLYGRLNIPADRYSAACLVFHVSVAVCFLSILRVPLCAEVIAHEHMSFYAVISVMEIIFKLLIAVSLTIFSSDKLIIYSCLLFLVQLLVNTFYHIYCRNKYEECRLSLKIENDRRLYKDIGVFAGWSMLGNVVWLGYTQGVNLMLNMFFGPVVNAARGVAVQVETAVTSFVSSFQTALNPQITKSYAEKDITRMHNLIVYSSKFSFYLYLVFAVPLFFQADNILRIWLVEVPEHSINFVRLTLIMLLITPIANPLGTSNDATGDIKNYQIVCSLINLQIIVVSYILLRMGYEPEVVLVVQIIIWSIQTFVKLLFAKSQVGLSLRYYIKKVVGLVFLVALVCTLLSYHIKVYFSNDILSVFSYIVISLIIVVSTIFTLGLSNSERILIISVILKQIKR